MTEQLLRAERRNIFLLPRASTQIAELMSKPPIKFLTRSQLRSDPTEQMQGSTQDKAGGLEATINISVELVIQKNALKKGEIKACESRDKQASRDYYSQWSVHVINILQHCMKNSSWTKGPVDHIVCQPSHDRPIFCLAINDNTFVTGSADHGLREYNIQNGKHIRQLYAKKYGHKEWVSTCAYTPTGHVLSGGMDSMVCYWDSKAVKCDHFAGHSGSISKVMGSQRVGISSSYDATIILWDLAKRTQSKKLIGPHKEAVMTFDWNQSLLVSGDKSGIVGIWDLNQGELVRALKTHKGSVSKIAIDGKQGLVYSLGLNDGSLAALDMRTNQGAFKQMVHKGAGNDIKVVDGKVITCSADHTINVLEVPSFKSPVHTDIKDMAFAIQYACGVIVAATSSGNIVASDANSGQILYGYGVIKKGQCRLLGLSKDKQKLVCAGEDDSPSLLCF